MSTSRRQFRDRRFEGKQSDEQKSMWGDDSKDNDSGWEPRKQQVKNANNPTTSNVGDRVVRLANSPQVFSVVSHCVRILASHGSRAPLALLQTTVPLAQVRELIVNRCSHEPEPKTSPQLAAACLVHFLRTTSDPIVSCECYAAVVALWQKPDNDNENNTEGNQENDPGRAPKQQVRRGLQERHKSMLSGGSDDEYDDFNSNSSDSSDMDGSCHALAADKDPPLQQVMDILSQLNTRNRASLLAILALLHFFVSEASSRTRVTGAVAALFGPALFRPRRSAYMSVRHRHDQTALVRLLHIMIYNADDLIVQLPRHQPTKEALSRSMNVHATNLSPRDPPETKQQQQQPHVSSSIDSNNINNPTLHVSVRTVDQFAPSQSPHRRDASSGRSVSAPPPRSPARSSPPAPSPSRSNSSTPRRSTSTDARCERLILDTVMHLLSPDTVAADQWFERKRNEMAATLRSSREAPPPPLLLKRPLHNARAALRSARASNSRGKIEVAEAWGDMSGVGPGVVLEEKEGVVHGTSCYDEHDKESKSSQAVTEIDHNYHNTSSDVHKTNASEDTPAHGGVSDESKSTRRRSQQQGTIVSSSRTYPSKRKKQVSECKKLKRTLQGLERRCTETTLALHGALDEERKTVKQMYRNMKKMIRNQAAAQIQRTYRLFKMQSSTMSLSLSFSSDHSASSASGSSNTRQQQQQQHFMHTSENEQGSRVVHGAESRAGGENQSSVGSLSLAELSRLKALKLELKQKLRAFDSQFEYKHGRTPTRKEKEPIRHMYCEYNAVKLKLERNDPYPKRNKNKNKTAISSNTSFSSSSSSSTSSFNRNNPRLTVHGKTSTIRNMRRPTSASTSDGKNNYNNNHNTHKGLNRHKGVKNGTHLDTNGETLTLLAELLQEKKTLQSRLRRFEKGFEDENGRKVKYAQDIKGLETQYQRYKHLKTKIDHIKKQDSCSISNNASNIQKHGGKRHPVSTA